MQSVRFAHELMIDCQHIQHVATHADIAVDATGKHVLLALAGPQAGVSQWVMPREVFDRFCRLFFAANWKLVLISAVAPGPDSPVGKFYYDSFSFKLPNRRKTKLPTPSQPKIGLADIGIAVDPVTLEVIIQCPTSDRQTTALIKLSEDQWQEVDAMIAEAKAAREPPTTH